MREVLGKLLYRFFFENNDCGGDAALSYNELHPNAHFYHTYVRKLVKKFGETGSVVNNKKKRNVQNTVRNEAV